MPGATLLLLYAACSSNLGKEGTDDVAEPQQDETPSEETLTAGAMTVKLLDALDIVAEDELDILRAQVTNTVYEADELLVTAHSESDGQLTVGAPDADGIFPISLLSLTAGWQEVSVVATDPGQGRGEATSEFGVCEWTDSQAFDTNLSGWRLYGDAHWDTAGWLELTGNQPGAAGQIFNVDYPVPSGAVDIQFEIYTGGGANTGADGFAMSIVNAATVVDLETFIENAANGGCLGYGVAAGCGIDTVVDAFHVEFDTWENEWDPTPNNHIGVMLDGNAYTHHLWAETHIEDSQWHEVTIEIDGPHVRLTLDGTAIIDSDVPGLDFEGGYIGFSGSTGWAYNHHRFRNLALLERCVVPADWP